MFEDYPTARMNNAKTYGELSLIALDCMRKMPSPLAQVSGPISTGGSGDMRENVNILKKARIKLEEQGYFIFNNLPFEIPMTRIYESCSGTHKEKNKMILEEFYSPILESGLIKKIFFIPTWDSSQGSCWENNKAKELGLEIIYLTEDFMQS